MPIRSPHPDVQIPDVTLPEMVLHRTTDLGDKPALIDGPTGRTITYGQLGDLVRRTAAGLAARGLRPGDVVAIFSPNLPEYAVAFHGVATAGGINTTANALYTAAELAFQLADSAARFLITIPAFMDRAGPAALFEGKWPGRFVR
jgi:acyl-CoA synthetase (AMP-forming)/AMP-acid ligase II